MGFVKAREEDGVSFLYSVPGRSSSENLKYFLGLFSHWNRTCCINQGLLGASVYAETLWQGTYRTKVNGQL